MSSAHHWEGRRRQWAIDKKASLQQDELIKRSQSNPSDQLKTCKDIPQLEISSGTLNSNFKPIRRYTWKHECTY